MDTFAQQLSERIDQHMRAVRALVGSDWQGDAANSHQDPWMDWETGARQIVSSFYQDSGALRTAATTYTSTDQGAADTIVQVLSSLNMSAG
jgi:WXG100 family type VII secretion target